MFLHIISPNPTGQIKSIYSIWYENTREYTLEFMSLDKAWVQTHKPNEIKLTLSV